MPIFAYRCRSCGEEFQTLVMSGEDADVPVLRERKPRAAAVADRLAQQGRRRGRRIGRGRRGLLDRHVLRRRLRLRRRLIGFPDEPFGLAWTKPSSFRDAPSALLEA